MVGYCEYGIIPLQHGKFHNEVNCNGFKGHGFRLCEYWLKRGACGSSVNLVSLTLGTPFDVVGYLPSESWPPVGSFDQLYSLRYAWVAVNRGAPS